jgi:hypothetical protein
MPSAVSGQLSQTISFSTYHAVINVPFQNSKETPTSSLAMSAFFKSLGRLAIIGLAVGVNGKAAKGTIASGGR